MDSLIPAAGYRGELDELRYENLDWWLEEMRSLSVKADTLTNNELTVFDID